MTAECSCISNLYLHGVVPDRVTAIGDLFPHATRLGGAPLNFAVHARKLGHPAYLVSALGNDDLGRRAAEQIGALVASCHGAIPDWTRDEAVKL